MNKHFTSLGAVILIALGAAGCAVDATDADQESAESAVHSSRQRLEFGGVSVGFGDKASRVLTRLQAKGIDAEMVDVLGYGPAIKAVGSEGTLTALAAGGRINFSITLEGVDRRVVIRDSGKIETLRNSRVSVPADVASALQDNAMKFGSVRIELGSRIADAADAAGTIVREQNNYGTTEFIFHFFHNGDPVAVTAGLDGKIRLIEIVHTVSTGARSRPIITTTHFAASKIAEDGVARGIASFNRINDGDGKEELYWANGESAVTVRTPFN